MGPDSTIASGTTGDELIVWKSEVERLGLDLRLADYTPAFSFDFHTSVDYVHQITTFDRDHVRRRLV